MDERLRELERQAAINNNLAPRLAEAYARQGDYQAAWTTYKNYLTYQIEALEGEIYAEETTDFDQLTIEQERELVEAARSARAEIEPLKADLASMNRLDQTASDSVIRKMSRVELTSGLPNFQPRDKSWKVPAIPARWAEADTQSRKKERDGDQGVVIWVGESQFGTKVGVKVDRFAELDGQDGECSRFRKLWGQKDGRKWLRDDDGHPILKRELPPEDDRVVFTHICNVELLPREADEWMWTTFRREAQVKAEARAADISKGDWVDVEENGAVVCGRVFWAGVRRGEFRLGIQPKGTGRDRHQVRWLNGAGARRLDGPCVCRFKGGERVATCSSHKKTA